MRNNLRIDFNLDETKQYLFHFFYQGTSSSVGGVRKFVCCVLFGLVLSAASTHVVASQLVNLGFKASPLNSDMSQVC